MPSTGIALSFHWGRLLVPGSIKPCWGRELKQWELWVHTEAHSDNRTSVCVCARLSLLKTTTTGQYFPPVYWANATGWRSASDREKNCVRSFLRFSWSTRCFGKNKRQEEERQRTDLETVTLHWQERLREDRGKDAQCVLVLHGKWLAQAQAMELEKDYCTLWTMDLKRKRKLDYVWVWMISHEKLRSCDYSQTNNFCISTVDILKYHTSVKYFNATLITACKGVK